MRLKFFSGKSDRNSHGTQKKGEPWNRETVRGWKLKFLDIKKANAWNKSSTRALIYWRIILYLPSGAWHHLDVTISRSLSGQ